jgi:hypothetical protein
MKIKIPVSVGELFDKISILDNKRLEITQADKVKNILKELNMLRKIAFKLDENFEKDSDYKKLAKINRALWFIEEGKRECERKKTFGQDFIDLARKVYVENDKRAKVKRAINKKYGSDIVEEKSYKKY